MGELVRRITQGDKTGMYYVQRVSVESIAAWVGFRETLTNDAPFDIHYSLLLLVHMSETLNQAGNQLMYDIRKKYGGHVNQSDTIEGKDAKKSQKEKNWVLNSMEVVDNLGGRTPAWPTTTTKTNNAWGYIS